MYHTLERVQVLSSIISKGRYVMYVLYCPTHFTVCVQVRVCTSEIRVHIIVCSNVRTMYCMINNHWWMFVDWLWWWCSSTYLPCTCICTVLTLLMIQWIIISTVRSMTATILTIIEQENEWWMSFTTVFYSSI